MPRSLEKLMVLVCAACGPSIDSGLAVGNERGPTVLTASCTADEGCPAGMVCEGCHGAHEAICIPGCRTNAQCTAPNHVCRGPVQCATCPCPPGWCELDPCRDLDADGFAFTNDPAIECPGKQKGDCNDLNKAVFPGAAERCANGVDDDCDGKTDRFDESCLRCLNDSVACESDLTVCGVTSPGTLKCSDGCCQSCPEVTDPLCSSSELRVGGGLDLVTGCRVARVCIPRTCATTDRVCGTDFATYASECTARLAGATVLRTGSCVWNEGMPCAREDVGQQGSCVTNQVCLTDAISGPRCVLRGTCRDASDCPAGQVFALCADGGSPGFTCVRGQCVPGC